MSPRSIFKILGGIIGTLLAGVGWKQIHDRQAQQMHDCGEGAQQARPLEVNPVAAFLP